MKTNLVKKKKLQPHLMEVEAMFDYPNCEGECDKFVRQRHRLLESDVTEVNFVKNSWDEGSEVLTIWFTCN